MIPKHIRKYYTYNDKFNDHKVGKEFCEHTIREIIKSYTKETLFRTFSSIAQSIGLGNNFEAILNYQQRQFQIPIEKEVVLIHRYAVSVIYQFLFSSNDVSFGEKKEVVTNDILLLFLLANQLSELVEGELLTIKRATGKKLFFSSIKEIHYTNTKDDLQAGFKLFRKYYQRMVDLNKDLYNSVIKKKFGFEINDYIKILDLIEQRNYPEIFSLFDKFAVLDFNSTNQTWQQRNPKFSIPSELPFIQKYPLIKINNEYLVTDLHSVFSSLFKNLYRVLLEYDNISFKGDFGKHIVEPTIIELLKEMFVDDYVQPLKVATK